MPVSVGTVLVLVALIGVMLAPLASDPLIHTAAAPLGSFTVGQKVEIARLPTHALRAAACLAGAGRLVLFGRIFRLTVEGTLAGRSPSSLDNDKPLMTNARSLGRMPGISCTHLAKARRISP